MKEEVKAKGENDLVINEKKSSVVKEKSVAAGEDGLGSKHSNSMDLLSLGSDGGINIQ